MYDNFAAFRHRWTLLIFRPFIIQIIFVYLSPKNFFIMIFDYFWFYPQNWLINFWVFFLQAETARRVLLNHISSKQVSLMDLACWLSLPAGPLHLNSQASLMHTAQQLQFSPVLFNTTRIKANCFCYVKKKKTNSLPVIKHYPCGVHKVIIFFEPIRYRAVTPIWSLALASLMWWWLIVVRFHPSSIRGSIL